MEIQISAKVAQELLALADASREDLAAQWERAHGCPPPPSVRRELLIYSAVWQIQTKRLGGFSVATRRLLNSEVERIKNSAAQAAGEPSELGTDGPNRFAANQAPRPVTIDAEVNSSGNPPRPARRRLSAGARLIREWQGRTFVVDVTESGYMFEGREHRSLTAIALQITGVQWSGPRFFGL